MKKYTLLTKADLIPGERYDAIVFYPHTSPNRNPMVESVYYDKFKQWCGTDKEISVIIDESVISVLLKYNPERACEIMQGGYEEDGCYNDLLAGYDYNLLDKLEKIKKSQ